MPSYLPLSFSLFRRRFRWGWGATTAVTLLLLLTTTLAAAQTETFPIEAYWQRLLLVQERAATNPTPAELAALANQLEQQATYQLPDGRLVTIQPKSLIQTLRQPEPDVGVIIDQIDALLLARDRWEGAQFGDGELALLAQILSDPAFDYAEPPPNVLEQFIRDLWLRTNAFFRNLLPDEIQGSPQLSALLSVLGIVGFVLVLGAALYSLYRSFYAEVSGIDPFEEEAIYLTADSALDRAHSFSNAGDYRTAVRYLYLSALLLLEEQGLIRYDRSQTNREYLRSVAHKPELATILRSVIEVFDRVWYGFQPLAASEYEAYAQMVERLKGMRS